MWYGGRWQSIKTWKEAADLQSLWIFAQGQRERQVDKDFYAFFGVVVGGLQY